MSLPPAVAVVLCCRGAPEGALNVIRSLGTMAVPVTLVTEERKIPIAASKYVANEVCLPDFPRHPDRLVECLVGLGRSTGRRPVVIPTADPDLMLLMSIRDRVESWCEVIAPLSDLGMQLSDKSSFAELASAHQLPVPATHVPTDLEDATAIASQVSYPAIVKPTSPVDWRPAELEGLDASAKAIRVDCSADFLRLAEKISSAGFGYLVQEFVPGDDAEHVDLHALIGRDGETIATFTGRKHRLYPPHAGSGCFAESVRIEAIVDIGLEVLRKIGLTGLANLNFKRHGTTGQYWLLEINPRVSQWSILATECGVNLPYLAYAEASGIPYSRPGPQRDGRRYLNFRRDRLAFREYRLEGSMGFFDYARSLASPWRTTYQRLSVSDPWPFVVGVTQKIARKARRLL